MNITVPPSTLSRALPADTAPARRAAPAEKPEPRQAGRDPPPELAEGMARANELLAQQGRNINFSWDKDTAQVIVTVRDAVTKEVIRQIPNEEALALAKSLAQHLDQFSATA